MGKRLAEPFLILVAFLLISAPWGLPQTETPPAARDASPESRSDEVLISAPRNVLRRLSEHGVGFQGLFVNDWSKALRPDADSAAGYGRYSFDLSAAVDTEKLFGLRGSEGFARLKHHIVEYGSTYDCAAQIYSNIDASSRTALYELWFQQRLLSNKLRIKGGRMDANSEFAVVQGAGDFLNSSMGYSPTILFFPTYPEPQPGASVFFDVANDYRISAGVFQTAGNGPLLVLEPGRKWTFGQGEHPGRVSLGYWRLQGRVDRFDGDSESAAQGYYSVFEQSVWHANLPLGEAERELSAFFQFGYTNGEVSPFTHHLGGGAVLSAPFRRRDNDAMGWAATWVRFTRQVSAGFIEPAELAIEVYYKITLTHRISLVPDLQFLHHPGGLPSNPDCAVLTQRFVLAF